MSEEDNETLTPPGLGPVSPDSFIRRRPEPLWVIAAVIVSPLVVILIIFIVRVLFL